MKSKRVRKLVFVSSMVTCLLIAAYANFFYLKKLDQDYSKLINQSSEIATTMQSIALNSAATYRVLDQMVDIHNANNMTHLTMELNKFIMANDSNFKRLELVPSSNKIKEDLDSLQQLRLAYHHAKDTLVNLINQSKFMEAKIYFSVLDRKFGFYSQKQLSHLLLSTNKTDSASQQLSNNAKKVGIINFGIIAIPIILIILLAMFGGFIVIKLLGSKEFYHGS